jgi:CPA1 family monovalent cation:H+ antiporter
MRTHYAAPGTVLLRRDEVPDRVWFIASGAVEQVRAGQVYRLGRGEMFGHLALVKRAPRRGQVTAIAHCTLLTLDEARFLALLRDDAGLRQAVLESAGKRGVALDAAALEAL